jgi:RNA polymerase sigma factor (sigma-70 family)
LSGTFRCSTFIKKFLKLADIPAKILTGCRAGNSKAQEELYRLVAPRMYGLCLQYTSNNDDAKDILQDGFIKVFQKIDQFEGKGSLEGWIRKIIVNTALERFRSQSITVSHDEKLVLKNEPFYDDIIDNMSAEDLLMLIRELSPQYRLVFNLYAIEGYSHKEIAEKLGISVGTSKSDLFRARAVLQEKVKMMNEIKKSI